MDDGLVIGKTKSIIDKRLDKLGKEFEISVSKDVKFFLGIEIQRDKRCLKLKQSEYAAHVVETFNMENS